MPKHERRNKVAHAQQAGTWSFRAILRAHLLDHTRPIGAQTDRQARCSSAVVLTSVMCPSRSNAILWPWSTPASVKPKPAEKTIHKRTSDKRGRGRICGVCDFAEASTGSSYRERVVVYREVPYQVCHTSMKYSSRLYSQNLPTTIFVLYHLSVERNKYRRHSPRFQNLCKQLILGFRVLGRKRKLGEVLPIPSRAFERPRE